MRPTLRQENRLMRAGGASIAGMDEAGRGALSGPVTVGAVMVDLRCGAAPAGLRDSKLLTPKQRYRLVPLIQRWAQAWGVGHASANEIDQLGLMGALRLAALRALAQLKPAPAQVLLDGNYDFLSTPAQDELALDVNEPTPVTPTWSSAAEVSVICPPVTTLVGADASCSSVAAASVLAKTARDRHMQELHQEFPQYEWASNKGYGAPAHRAALRQHGASPHHRRSWELPLPAAVAAGS